MKQSLLALFAIFFVTFSYGQISLQEQGSTTVVGGYEDFDMNYHIYVLNSSSSPISVHAERNVTSETEGSKNYFCWGVNCYPSSVDKSNSPVTIAPGEVNETFIGYYEPRYNSGVTTIQYKFSLADNEFISSTIDVTYDATQATGVNENANEVLEFQAYPSVTNGLTTIKYDLTNALNNVIEIRSITGQLVKAIEVQGTKGALLLDASNFAKGIYLYSLKNEGVLKMSNKLIVH